MNEGKQIIFHRPTNTQNRKSKMTVEKHAKVKTKTMFEPMRYEYLNQYLYFGFYFSLLLAAQFHVTQKFNNKRRTRQVIVNELHATECVYVYLFCVLNFSLEKSIHSFTSIDLYQNIQTKWMRNEWKWQSTDRSIGNHTRRHFLFVFCDFHCGNLFRIEKVKFCHWLFCDAENMKSFKWFLR